MVENGSRQINCAAFGSCFKLVWAGLAKYGMIPERHETDFIARVIDAYKLHTETKQQLERSLEAEQKVREALNA